MESLTEGILTVTFRETEFENQDESDQSSIVDKFRSSGFHCKEVNAFLAVKNVFLSKNMSIDTLMGEIG